MQAKTKSMLHDISLADTRAAAERALDPFLATYGPKYPAAASCLERDREALLAFYDFPAEHLDAHSDDESDRNRHGSTTDEEDEGCR